MIIGSESEVLEFKLTTGEKKEATEAIAAILNKHCKGTLYFGVDDNGFVTGQQITDSTKKDVSRTINDLIEPKITPTIEELKVDGRQILKVSFSGRNRPYSSGGKYLIRIGTENKKMTNEDLKRLIRHDDYSSKWEEEMTNHTIEDIDDTALLDFYKSACNCGRLNIPQYDKERLLACLDLMTNNFINNGCFALFGKDAKIGLKLATYATENKVIFIDLKLLNGNIYNLITQALQYVLNHINWKPIITKRKREETPEIPEMALREIIVNAFAHSDYETSPEIEIGIHPGKIEIYNPGSFPEDLTPYDFINKNMPSYKRNKLILDVLFRSKDVEKSGTGFQRVNELCKESNVKWGFRKEAYGFFFEFYRPGFSTIPKTEETETLNDNEKMLLKLISNESRVSKKDMAIKLGKSEKTVQRTLLSLYTKGYIHRIGSNKDGYWEKNDNQD